MPKGGILATTDTYRLNQSSAFLLETGNQCSFGDPVFLDDGNMNMEGTYVEVEMPPGALSVIKLRAKRA